METTASAEHSQILVGYVRLMLRSRLSAIREIFIEGNRVFIYDGMRHVVDIAFCDTTQTFEVKRLNGEVVLRGDYDTAITSIADYLKSIDALNSGWEI